ncbi:hypothetical protein [Bifidobacterium sp.]|jgi:hypothetical protein|uniref:hypothetical protein n=1 Tax=Bifidobacterium sp. TaxID=41200 RepID=UPI0025C0AF09|nr:hypothetical protein [Bifidobacterium sp.]MCI1635380.1 hypothetical protein [Bifidobacterium sp.]
MSAQEHQEHDVHKDGKVFTRLLGLLQRIRARYQTISTPLAWVTIVVLWALAGVAGVSIANSTYRVFGDVIITALGLDSFDIMVSGSSDVNWNPDSSAVSDWEQGTAEPYIVDVPEASALLIPGTTIWNSVLVKNTSQSASGSLKVSIRDAYRADSSVNLFTHTTFSLECDGVTLLDQVPGSDLESMTGLSITRVLNVEDVMLCHVGVALRPEVFSDNSVTQRRARVIPQLLFEGVQR